MTVVEKIAYTKGFFSGLNIDSATAEGKAFNALLELLEELVVSNADLEKQCESLKDQVSEIDEYVSEMFNDVFDNASFEHSHDFSDDAILYEVICPECGERTTFGQRIALRGYMECPGCGLNLEFDYDEELPDELEEAELPGSEQAEAFYTEPVVTEEPFGTAVQVDQSASEFVAPPPVPKPAQGEDDRIPQTEEFVYSETQEEEEDAPADAVKEVVSEPEADAVEEMPEADEKADAESALVKVEFVADREAFEAGRMAAKQYKFSEDNVNIDFDKLIPSGMPAEDAAETDAQ